MNERDDHCRGVEQLRDGLQQALADRLRQSSGDQPTDPADVKIDQHLLAAHRIAARMAAREQGP